mgnify:CR=1 FL=1
MFPNRMGRDAWAWDDCLHNAAQRDGVVLKRWDVQCTLVCKCVRVLAWLLGLCAPTTQPFCAAQPQPFALLRRSDTLCALFCALLVAHSARPKFRKKGLCAKKITENFHVVDPHLPMYARTLRCRVVGVEGATQSDIGVQTRGRWDGGV